VHFVVPSIVLPYASKGSNPTGQRPPLSILVFLDKYYPILAFGELSSSGLLCNLSRLRDVEDEDTARGQRIVYAMEESNQRLTVVARIKQVIEDLAQRGYGVAWWDVGLE